MSSQRFMRRIPSLFELCVKNICIGLFKDDKEGRNWKIGIGLETKQNMKEESSQIISGVERLPLEIVEKLLSFQSQQGLISDLSLGWFLSVKTYRFRLLNLSSCLGLTDEGVELIAKNCGESIQHLNFGRCSLISSKSVTTVLALCSNLQHLFLPNCYLVDDSAFLGREEFLQFRKSIKEAQKINSNDSKIEPSNYPLKLKVLNLSHCSISNDSIHRLLELCPETLEQLSFSGCKKIDDSSISSLIQTCSKLSVLDVGDCNQLTSQILKTAAQYCSNLESISLSGCYMIADDGVLALADGICTNLMSINLKECNQISDISITKLARKMTKLESVDLSWCAVTDESLKSFQDGKSLKILKLAWCNLIEEPSIVQVFAFVSLFNYVSWRTIQNNTFDCISKYGTSLTSLDLSSCNNITSDILSHMSRLTALKVLNLSWCKGLDDAAMNSIVKNCCNLKMLDISLCSQVTDAGFSNISNGCSSLSGLVASKCIQLSDNALIEITRNNREIFFLNLTEWQKLTDLGLHQISFYLHDKLRVLILNSCKGLTDEGLVDIFKTCTALTTVGLNSVNKMTDKSLITLGNHCKRITTISMSECLLITDEGLSAIANHCKYLQNLHISWCKEITDSSVIEIIRSCPCLESLEASWCKNMTDFIILEICRYRSQLFKTISLTGILQKENLNLLGCTSLTEQSVFILQENLEKFKRVLSVDLTNCPKITSSSLHKLKGMAKRMNIKTNEGKHSFLDDDL